MRGVCGGMKLIIVNSHERSGTHFLMNTLALNFDYVSYPYYNFDLPVLPHMPVNILATLQGIREPRHIVKSHYEGTFFKNVLANIAMFAHVFYISREEDGVFNSCSKHFNDCKWDEAHKSVDGNDLKKLEPYGGCMRYQYQQYPTMLMRWEAHKMSWDLPSVIQIKYENLVNQFDKTVRSISRQIGIKIVGGIARKPDRSNTVQNGEFDEKEVK